MAKVFDVNEYIERQMEEIDIADAVYKTISSKIDDEVRRSLREIVNARIAAVIDQRIEAIMSGEVETDDGWGKKEKYPSFEVLFKTEFNKKMDSQWEMKRILESAVKQKVEQLFNSNFDALKKRFAEELSKV